MDEKWFYCVRHHRPEHASDGCPALDRLGPYDSKEQAEHALEIAEARNKAWDEDPRWNDD